MTSHRTQVASLRSVLLPPFFRGRFQGRSCGPSRCGRRCGPMRAGLALSAVVTVALLVACSSTPEATGEVTEVSRQAARNMDHGTESLHRGRIEDARAFFDTALRQYRSLDHRTGVAGALAAFGRLRTVEGDLAAAAAHYRDSAELAEIAGAPAVAIESYAALVEIELRRGRTDAAEQAIDTAATILERSPDSAGTAVTLHARALLAADHGDFERAEKYLREALSLNRELGKHREIAANRYMLASVLSRQGRFEEALNQASAALETDKFIENSVGIAQDLVALGRISERSGDRVAAQQYFERAYSVYLGLEDGRGLEHVENLLAGLHASESR